MAIRIPNQQKPVFKAIAEADDISFAKTTAVIAGLSPTLDLENLVTRVSEADTGLPANISKMLAPALIGLIGGMSKRSIDVVGSEMREALSREYNDGITQDDLERFELRIRDLMLIPSIRLTSIARATITDHPRVYLSASMITDVRPIYSEVPFDKPLGAAIVNTLKVSYQENEVNKEIHFALDTNDLDNLREAIDLALRETRSAKTMISDARVQYISVKEDGE